MVAYHWRRMGFLGALRPKSRQSLSFARSEAPENSSEVDAEMLAKFFQFYASDFDWQKEVVSLQGTYHPKKTELLWIEDPVEPGVDLAGPYLSPFRLARLRGEFRRAQRLLRAGAGWEEIFQHRGT
ncbi:unnamed protein product, partial [Effrenium voratum]